MEIKGQITIFPEKKTKALENGEAEEFIACRGTISSKNEAGEYINKSVSVKFAGKDLTKEKKEPIRKVCGVFAGAEAQKLWRA